MHKIVPKVVRAAKLKIAELKLSGLEEMLDCDCDGTGLPDGALAEARDLLNELREVLEAAPFVLRDKAKLDAFMREMQYKELCRERGCRDSWGDREYLGFRRQAIDVKWPRRGGSKKLRAEVEKLYRPAPR